MGHLILDTLKNSKNFPLCKCRKFSPGIRAVCSWFIILQNYEYYDLRFARIFILRTCRFLQRSRTLCNTQPPLLAILPELLWQIASPHFLSYSINPQFDKVSSTFSARGRPNPEPPSATYHLASFAHAHTRQAIS